MSAANQPLADRYQFIQILSAHDTGKTLLVADVHYPEHPKCVIRQLQLSTRNPITLKFVVKLLQKKVKVLEIIGRHRQIPSTFSSFEIDHNFYLVQEFIPGRSMESELIPGQPMSEQAVLSLLIEALTALAFAQGHGVVHGRLKPSKMIRHRTDNRLVLLDFGSIKHISQEISNKDSGQSFNHISPANRIYNAPEQRQGQARFCTDHYALGMIAIQALTGLPPEEFPDVNHPAGHQEIIALLQAVPGSGINTASLLARMVHPNPDRRYQKAAEILVDLERLTGMHSPVSVMPSSEPLSPTTPPKLDTDAIIATTVNQAVSPTVPQMTSTPTVLTDSTKKTPWAIGGILGIIALALAAAVIGLRLPQRVLSAQQIRDAQAQSQLGNSTAAIAHYTRALELHPNNAAALASRSQLHAQAGNIETALADLTRALEITPNNAEAFASRSQLHLQTDDTEASLADITRAIELSPNNPTFPYDRANLRFSLGDIQGAIKDYTQTIRQDPSFTRAYVNRGSARADWGDDQGAVEDYTRAIELDPPPETKAATYLNRCLSYSNLGEQDLALADCSVAINLRPSHGLAYQNRGLVRRRLEDFQGSLQDYNIAIQIAPDSPDPYYNRGLTREAMNDLVGAMQDFSKAITIDPNYVFALYDRGLLHLEMGQPNQALEDFQQASRRCLDLGRTGCYEDAQYQISLLQNPEAAEE